MLKLSNIQIKKLIIAFIISLLFASTNCFYSENKSVGIFILFFIPCFIVFSLINIFKEKIFSNSHSISYEEKDKKFFCTYFIVLLIAWFVILLAFFPGFVNYDSCYSVENFYEGNFVVTPITYMLIQKLFWNINDFMFPLGFILLFIFQIVLYDLSISFMLLFLYRIKSKKIIRILTLIFFAISPIISLQTIVSTKDILFAPFFVFLITILSYFVYDKKIFDKKLYFILFIISMIFIALLRNNGLIIFYVSSLLLFFLFIKNTKLKIMLFLTVFLGTLLLLIIPQITKINDKIVVEALSVPLQNVSRLYKYHYDEIENEDVKLIENTIYNINLYNPYISDIVKKDTNSENLNDFTKLWLKYLFKNPGVFLESILYNNQGYIFVFDTSVVELYYDETNNPNPSLFDLGSSKQSGIVETSYVPFINNLFNDIFRLKTYENSIILQMLFNLYPYTWLFIFFGVYLLLSKNSCKIVIALINFALFATLIIGPCVLPRYIFPIISVLPLIAFLSVIKEK